MPASGVGYVPRTVAPQVEAQAQPIETIQDAAHRAAEKTAAAVVELQTTAEKQGECLVQ